MSRFLFPSICIVVACAMIIHGCGGGSGARVTVDRTTSDSQKGNTFSATVEWNVYDELDKKILQKVGSHDPIGQNAVSSFSFELASKIVEMMNKLGEAMLIRARLLKYMHDTEWQSEPIQVTKGNERLKMFETIELNPSSDTPCYNLSIYIFDDNKDSVNYEWLKPFRKMKISSDWMKYVLDFEPVLLSGKSFMVWTRNTCFGTADANPGMGTIYYYKSRIPRDADA